MARPPVRVLGVDTSLRSSGIGVVEAHGQQLASVSYDTIVNPAKRLHSDCLHHIYTRMIEVIEQTQPQVVAVEGIFFYKNVRTAVVLGQARGVVLAASAACGLPVYEYSPRRVKQAIVGGGAAHKQQVSHMVVKLLGLDGPPPEDAADALAIAICHIHSSQDVTGDELKRI